VKLSEQIREAITGYEEDRGLDAVYSLWTEQAEMLEQAVTSENYDGTELARQVYTRDRRIVELKAALRQYRDAKTPAEMRAADAIAKGLLW